MTDGFETIGMIMVYGAQKNGVLGINEERGLRSKVRTLTNQQDDGLMLDRLSTNLPTINGHHPVPGASKTQVST